MGILAVDLTALSIRFHEKVFPEPNSGCWLWLGAPDKDGYGELTISPGLGVKYKLKSHHIAYILYKGKKPVNKQILHNCDNRSCASPYHIYAGTHQQNMRDKAARSTYRGENHVLARFTNKQVKDIKNLLAKKVRVIDIARLYKVPDVTIHNIKHGRSWRHI